MEYEEYLKYATDCMHLRITPFCFSDVPCIADYIHSTELIQNELHDTSYNPLLYTIEKKDKETHFHLLLTKIQMNKLIKYIKTLGALGNKSFATSKVKNPLKLIKYIVKTDGWEFSGLGEDCVEILIKFSKISYNSVKDIQEPIYRLEDELMLLNIGFDTFCEKYVDLCVQYNAQTRIMQLRKYFKFIKIRHRYVKYEKHHIIPQIKKYTIMHGIHQGEIITRSVADYKEIRACYISEAMGFYHGEKVKNLNNTIL